MSAQRIAARRRPCTRLVGVDKNQRKARLDVVLPAAVGAQATARSNVHLSSRTNSATSSGLDAKFGMSCGEYQRHWRRVPWRTSTTMSLRDGAAAANASVG